MNEHYGRFDRARKKSARHVGNSRLIAGTTTISSSVRMKIAGWMRKDPP